ncbi:MAG: hypothetical protein EBY32_01705 [Proteobacteria bacterium]|jgi:hypothetical protein|nr:hypothetical protein [Pseudomonadota bacterium]
MPAKKTSQSAATKVKTTSEKAVKTSAKKIAKPAEQDTAKPTATLEAKVKKAASKSTETPKATTPPPASSAPHILREDIQLRAYFISERRQTMGWPGNSSTDWIEAESQLVAEAKRRLKKTL